MSNLFEKSIETITSSCKCASDEKILNYICSMTFFKPWKMSLKDLNWCDIQKYSTINTDENTTLVDYHDFDFSFIRIHETPSATGIKNPNRINLPSPQT